MKKKIFSVLVKFLKLGSNKKLFILLPIIALFFLFYSHPALAAFDVMSAVDYLLGVLGSFITKLAGGIGQIIVTLIGMVTIPLLQYDAFVTSPVVGMGWAIVRDVVNMFYVIVLILIAFGTVLGIDRYKWRDQIPSLLGTAVLVNFSRTLCGIMIDFSQIMTLTFVNAIKDIAGGNFVQLFGLQSIMDANSASKLFDATGATPPTDTDIFIASLVALMMMLIVLVTMIFLTIIFAYRIVLLWSLIIVAPLAWFFKGAGGALNKTGPYTTWWSRFNCALQVGPILTFFLWLALAVAGSGNIASTAGFTTSNAPVGEGLDVGSLLKAMTMEKMIGFVIGIALIFVGFDQANSACSSGDGIINGLLKQGKSAMQPIAMAPVAGAALAAKYGWKGARGAQKSLYNQTIGRGMAKTRNLAGGVMGKMGSSRLMPTSMQAFFSTQAAKIKAKETAEAEAAVKDRPMTKEGLVAYLKRGPSMFDVNNREYSARIKEALGRDDVMKDLKENPEVLKKILGQTVGATFRDTAESRFRDTFAGDPAALKQLDALKKSMPVQLGGGNVADAVKGAIQSDDDIRALPKDQFKEEAIFDHVRKMPEHEFIDSNGRVHKESMPEAIKRGRLGRTAKEGWEAAEAQFRSSRSASKLLGGKANIADISEDDISRVIDWNEENGASDGVVARILASGDQKKIAAVRKAAGLDEMVRDMNSTGKKNKDKRERARTRMNSLMLAGESVADTAGRANFRQAMVGAGIGAGHAFNMEKGAGNIYSFVGTGKEDFDQAASNDPDLIVKALEEVKKGGGSQTQIDDVVNSRAKEIARKLLERIKDPKVTLESMKEAESSFEKIFDTARIGTSSAAASDQDVVNAYLEIKNSVMAKKQEVFSPDKLKAILFDGARKGKEFSISEFTNGVETEVRFAGVTPEEIRKKVLQYIKDKNIT